MLGLGTKTYTAFDIEEHMGNVGVTMIICADPFDRALRLWAIGDKGAIVVDELVVVEKFVGDCLQASSHAKVLVKHEDRKSALL